MLQLALVLSLALCASAAPVPDFDAQQMRGTWYLVGFASNADWFVAKKSDMRVGKTHMTPNAEGDLNLALASPTATGCWRASHLARKTTTAGEFEYRSEVWQDDNVMTVVEVQYDNFALIRTTKTKTTGIQIIYNLYTRGLEFGEELRAKFTTGSKEAGVLKDNIVFLQADTSGQVCEPETSS